MIIVNNQYYKNFLFQTFKYNNGIDIFELYKKNLRITLAMLEGLLQIMIILFLIL